MSTNNLQSVDFILDRIKDKENLTTDAELAEFLDRKPGTISAWRTRETLDWELILTKCSSYINELLYGKKAKLSGVTIKDPEGKYDDIQKSEYEKFSVELIKKVEDSPFSQSTKLQIIDSLIRILRDDLEENK